MTTYFISNKGDDTNNSGTSPTSPWATMEAFAMRHLSLKPGEAVLFSGAKSPETSVEENPGEEGPAVIAEEGCPRN
jgi:hypothetical protein